MSNYLSICLRTYNFDDDYSCLLETCLDGSIDHRHFVSLILDDLSVVELVAQFQMTTQVIRHVVRVSMRVSQTNGTHAWLPKMPLCCVLNQTFAR